MKNSRDESFLSKIFFAPVTVAAAVLALGVQLFLARGAAGNRAFFPLLVRGGIVNIIILVLGCLGLCMVIRNLFCRIRSLEMLTRPLLEKDYAALAALSGDPIAGIPVSGTDSAVPPLRESLTALGTFLAALDARISKTREMKDALDGETAEQDAALRSMEETIEAITNQFSTIEARSKQGLAALENLETGLKTLNGVADGQSVPPEISGGPMRLSRTEERSESAAERLRESTDRARKIGETAGTGEDQARETADLVKAVIREVDNITGMIKTINQISEQTNILSMNAAIESAHAGQAGAGFAVVAGEIRKLADSTRENAGRIHGELREIAGKTGGALKASENSFRTFNEVAGEINRLAKDLAEILADAETGVPEKTPEDSSGEAAPVPERTKENISGMMAHYQTCKTTLEQIGYLSGAARTEVREIHSGTREILGNIHTARTRFLQYLEKTKDLEQFLPSAAPLMSPAVSSSHPARTASPAAPQTGERRPRAEEIPKETYSDSREVTVKKPPRTIP
ncbi:MAG: methyl-accepting chemotaxis protein [Treponema sp.]|jgi:methyl-accepting chemotaxis protein|nr:methyl-accepting chemotaxis protein [Treponema sp.]